MTDGLGSVSYNYNNLSQLTSETRNFTGIASLTLSYGYNLAGELSGITNQWGSVVGYGYDKSGRLSGVTGSGLVSAATYASAISYRAFGSVKGMSYGDTRALTTAYDNRLRPTTWNVANVLGYNYNYDYLNERTGRVTYAQNIQDATLDRSYEYDQVGRLAVSHSGTEARAHVGTGSWGTQDGPYSQGYEFDVWGNVTHKYGWGGEVQGGSPTASTDINYSYTGNRRNGFSYDAAGNLTNDLGQTFTYDATGQQTLAAYGGYSLQQTYDGDGLRVKKSDNGTVTYYLRSSVLGGQVVAETNSTGGWTRGYIYAGSQLLAVQQQASVYWMHEDPITKSKRVTNSGGTVVSTVEMDPWGADTNRSSNAAFQPKKFTSYERDSNGTDEAMARRYNRWQSRFDQPDPYDGSYSLTNPQSFNRYAYVQGDPVNFGDPSGLMEEATGYCGAMFSSCAGGGGGGYGGTPFDSGSYFMGGYNDLPGNIAGALRAFDQRNQTTLDGLRAQDALNHNDFDRLEAILNGNPNVGISVQGVQLWGEFAGSFIGGYAGVSKGLFLASTGDIYDVLLKVPGALMSAGWKALVNKLSKIRGPDFQLVNINAVAGITRFIARGDDMSTALQGVSAGQGAQISYAVGWMLQTATPNPREIRNWGSGLSISADAFFIGGGGIIRSASSSTRGVYAGFGAGGGWGASFQYPVP
jgi:RHS repeat-associated protein